MYVERRPPVVVQPPYRIGFNSEWEIQRLIEVLENAIQHNLHAPWCMELKAMIASAYDGTPPG